MRINDEIWLTLPVPPRTNGRLPPNKRGGVYRKKENSDYQKLVKLECMKLRLKPYPKDVAMRVWWYRKYRKGDIPDRWKDLCDALQGFAYNNDSQIADFHVARFPLNEGKPDQTDSHIVVNIKPLEK